jgi:hypothetical protein
MSSSQDGWPTITSILAGDKKSYTTSLTDAVTRNAKGLAAELNLIIDTGKDLEKRVRELETELQSLKDETLCAQAIKDQEIEVLIGFWGLLFTPR